MTWHGSFDGFISLLKEGSDVELSEILQKFQNEEDSLIADVERRIQALEKESAEKLDRLECEDVERTRWLYELEKRNQILASKRQEIDRVSLLATERLAEMVHLDSERFTSLYRSIIVQVMDDLSLTAATLQLSEVYQSLRPIMQDIDSLEIVVAGTDQSIRLVSNDTGIEIDLSPRKLVASVKDRYEQSIIGVLFE